MGSLLPDQILSANELLAELPHLLFHPGVGADLRVVAPLHGEKTMPPIFSTDVLVSQRGLVVRLLGSGVRRRGLVGRGRGRRMKSLWCQRLRKSFLVGRRGLAVVLWIKLLVHCVCRGRGPAHMFWHNHIRVSIQLVSRR